MGKWGMSIWRCHPDSPISRGLLRFFTGWKVHTLESPLTQGVCCTALMTYNPRIMGPFYLLHSWISRPKEVSQVTSFPGSRKSELVQAGRGGVKDKRCPSLKVWLGSTMTVIQGWQAEGNTVGWEDWVWVLLSLGAILVLVSGQRARLQRHPQRMQVMAHAETMATRWHHVVQCMCLVCTLYVQCMCLVCAMWCANVCHCNISAPLLVHMITLHFKKLKK